MCRADWFEDGLGREDAAVHVRFSREIKDRVTFRRHRFKYCFTVANVAFDKRVAFAADSGEILQIAGIRESVVVDDRHVRVACQQLANKSRPNKSGTAGHEDLCHCLLV